MKLFYETHHNVLSSVMYVPPTLGSLILAKNAIQATNIEYKQILKQNETKPLVSKYGNFSYQFRHLITSVD